MPPELGLPDVAVIPPATPPSSQSLLPAQQSSPPSIVRSTSPPAHLTNLPPADAVEHLGAHLPDGLAPPQPPQSPGSWSTAATPGTPGFHLDDAGTPTSASPRAGRTAFVSGELEGRTDEELEADMTPPGSAGAKSVHFSPSVVGGLGTPLAPAPDADLFFSPHAPPQPSAPPFDGPAGSVHGHPSGPPASRATRTSPPSVPPSASSPPRAAATSAGRDARTATVTTSPAELTPQVIARAQKHCRFAISALDYEDAEQAIKELRQALRMLGG